VSRYQNSTYRGYVLCFLTLIYAVNFIDRQLLSILQESIKADLGFSDTQLGLLTGFAFALFYVIAGIPMARWADRSSRRNVISISIGLWSLMTAVSGMANNFVQMLLARIGVGIGESGCSPPAHSMISDMYAPEKRATALSFYSVGINIGIMLGFLLGGVINQYFGWRTAFFVVGAPGILLALWFYFTVSEPERGWSEKKQISTETVPFGDVLSLIFKQRHLLHISAGAAMSALAGYALLNWTASYYIRVHQISTAEVGAWLAGGVGVIGSLGTFGWGYLCDRLGKHDSRWYAWLPSIAITIAIPVVIFVFLAKDPQVGLRVNLLVNAFTTGYVGAALAIFHGAVAPRMRATASALYFLIINIVGLGIGPTLIGAVSDALASSHGIDSLRYAILIVVPIACVWSAWHFILAARVMPKEAQKV